ncbi:madf domain transcription factor [Holotrichia oblita]|uniref:Madf domain transcription factor n=1 Tax=Holotrichia oblita TaxID=644536 RepID=A0ACB9SQB2_HOLOL|nr:madf domain transcription factor [Holotrichia oblita]
MDIEKLILLVFERKPLWDVKSKSYHNRDVARKLWREIAEEYTCEGCKANWQNLRDNFRREPAKFLNTPTGSAALDDTISLWKYYKQLWFLVDVFSSRKMQTNIPPVSSQLPELADADISTQALEDEIMAPANTIDTDGYINNGPVDTQ